MSFQLINPFALLGLLGSTRDAQSDRPLGSRIKLRLQEERRYRETVVELERLNDRELEDLGIHRVDIPAIARSSARGIPADGLRFSS